MSAYARRVLYHFPHYGNPRKTPTVIRVQPGMEWSQPWATLTLDATEPELEELLYHLMSLKGDPIVQRYFGNGWSTL